MIFFSQKIKFKKQSESTALNLKDKQIRKDKQQLLQLTKKHKEVDDSLKRHKKQFERQKTKLLSEHQALLEEEKRRKQKILKLQIRKDQLLSKSNPTITQCKAKVLKKYLKSMIYTIGDRYGIIKYLGNFSTYDFIKTKMLNLQHRLYLKTKMKEIVFMKKVEFEGELLMLLIKQRESPEIQRSARQISFSSHKSKTLKSINPSKFNPSTDNLLKSNKTYEVNIYAVTGKSFNYCKVYSEKELIYFIDRLMNKKKLVQIENHFDFNGKNQQNRVFKPRLSLEFNQVFKKSLEGFFFKRSSLTANQLQNKSINLDQIQKRQGIQQKRSRKESDSSINELLQTSQNLSQINSTRSKRTHTQSQFISSHQTHMKIESEKTSNLFQNDNYISGQSQKTNEQNQQIQDLVKCTQKQIPNNNYEGSNENSSRNKIGEESFNGFVRSFLYGQKSLFPDTNPLLNIVILKKKNTFQFLPEYLEKKQKFDLINLCVKKYQLKIKLQKQVRKYLLYRKVKIQKFFETENKEIEPFSLEVFFSVKYAKNDIYIPKTSDITEHLRQGKLYHFHEKLKGKHKNIFDGVLKDLKTFNSGDIVITCQNIRCQKEVNKTFVINHLLREEIINDLNSRVFNMINNSSTGNTRAKGRLQHLQIKKRAGQSRTKDDKLKDDRKRIRRRKNSKDKIENNEELKEEDERKDLIFREEIQNMFESFLEGNLLSIKEYRFLRKINYPAHLNKIVIIQKNLKCFYYKKLYKKQKLFPLIFKFDPNTKIFISAILDSEKHEIKIFTECLVLRLNNKYKSHPLIFSQKYWTTIGTALANLTKMSESIVEVEDELGKYLEMKVSNYEKEQARLEALKPELYLNRLRRFFINIMLRVKVKRNIIYLKKIYTNLETYILIIRRSAILSTVCQANLYRLEDLQEKQQIKRNTRDILEDDRQVPGQFKTGKSFNFEERKKVKYQTINLLVEYFSGIPKQKIPEEFYFDNEHFLLKPPRNKSIFYIERLLVVDINSQEITKEITMIEWQDPAKKKRVHENGSFLNLGEASESSKMLREFNSKNQMLSSAMGLKSQQLKLNLKRVNPSIIVEEQMQKKPALPNDKVLKQRKQFRISGRNKCVLLREEQNRPRNNSKEQFRLLGSNKKETPLLMNEGSRSKLMSNSRLSRSSLYDIFNNSANKRWQYEIRGNGHGRLIYYSLAKVQEVFYQMQIYIVKRTYLVMNNPLHQQISQLGVKSFQNKRRNRANEIRNKNDLLLGEKINYQCQQQSRVDQSQEFIKRSAFSDELILVHREHVNKKELLEANWTFFYHRIAYWIKRNQRLLVLVDD